MFSVVWTSNGVAIGLGDTDSLLGAWRYGRTVTPNDGTTNGLPESDDAVITNALPAVAGVQITPNPATSMDALSCGYQFTDTDGDADQSLVEWTVNGSPLGVAQSLAAGLALKGDTVTCTVTPFDGIDFGASVTDTLVIGNQAPTVSDVTVASVTNMDNDDSSTAVGRLTGMCAFFSDGWRWRCLA